MRRICAAAPIAPRRHDKIASSIRLASVLLGILSSMSGCRAGIVNLLRHRDQHFATEKTDALKVLLGFRAIEPLPRLVELAIDLLSARRLLEHNRASGRLRNKDGLAGNDLSSTIASLLLNFMVGRGSWIAGSQR
jgi:hypothetical protein